jgi:hypothetical protein
LASPPFTTLSNYAAVVAEQVPDTKATRSDSDLVLDALERYSEEDPCEEHVDLGDGSTTAWDLSASPFAYTAPTGSTPAVGFLFGFSDKLEIKAEDLASAGVSQRPRVFRAFGESRDFWLERRTSSGALKTYLVFDAAPPTNLVRVHFKKRWTIHATVATNVPLHMQLAVVDLACALKCEILASVYRRMVDSVGGSDVFSAIDRADSYDKKAQGFWAAYRRALGIPSKDVPSIVTGRARTGQSRVFSRGLPS